MNIGQTFIEFANQSGFATMTWQQGVMIVVACILLYLAIVKGFEPLLLLPIAFGMLLANLPAAGRAYLPVRVENGSGTVTLWAQDNAYVRLTVQSVEVVRALPAMDLYERSGEGKGL